MHGNHLHGNHVNRNHVNRNHVNRNVQAREPGITMPAFTTRRALTIGFVLMLFLPVTQMEWRFVKEHALGGVEAVPDSAPASFSTWFDGSLASSISDRISRKIGFRALCVRTINQTKLAMNNSMEAGEANGVVMGKDHWLYESIYVRRFAKPIASVEPSEAHRFVARIKNLQDMLAKQGKSFLVVIAPSKAEFYPEFLPDDAIEQRQQFQSRRFCDQCREEFATQGVHCVDAPKILRQYKSKSDLLFSRTGTHWNYLACFLVWREVLQAVNQQSTLNIPIPELAAVQYDAPRGTDNDLGNLLNLLAIPGGLPNVPYPIVKVNPVSFDKRPDFLFVGTSFTHTLVDTAYLAQSARHSDSLYYYKTILRCDTVDPRLQGGESVEMAKIGSVGTPSFDWQQVLFDKDVVVLEFLEIHGPEFDFGFCEDALAAMHKTPAHSAGNHHLERTAATGGSAQHKTLR